MALINESVRETRSDNGLVVLTDEMSGVRSATLGFFYRVGSRNEPDELNGITHFIEHCVFKGTAKRSAMDIAIEQDRLGGNLDAFTTHEETGFVIKVIDDQLERGFELLSEMLTQPRFDETDLKNERRVIIEEIKMNDDSPEELLGDIFHRDFFRSHPLGLKITGTPKTVRTFDETATRRYHAAAFAPQNLIIAAAGNIKHKQVLELAARLKFPEPDKAAFTVDSFAPQPSASFHVEDRPELEQAHMMFGIPVVGASDDRRYAVDLLCNILGGGTSSRLWQKVREERGLAYNIGAAPILFRDCGFISVFGATSPEHLKEVVEIVVAELDSFVKDGPTADELQLSKDQTAASILMSLEDSASRAAGLAGSEMAHGRQVSFQESLDNVAAVSVDDIHNAARDFFVPEKTAFAAIGDLAKNSVTRKDLLNNKTRIP